MGCLPILPLRDLNFSGVLGGAATGRAAGEGIDAIRAVIAAWLSAIRDFSRSAVRRLNPGRLQI